jgi:hypothetical protein
MEVDVPAAKTGHDLQEGKVEGFLNGQLYLTNDRRVAKGR